MQKLDKGTILLFIILIALMTICIYIYINKILTPTINNNQVIAKYELEKSKNEEIEEVEEIVEEQTEEDKMVELKSMSEIERIHEYFTEYINTIDARNIEKAYEYLYPEFKQNYFPEISDFENYINENYPEYLVIEYTDIERQGTYYILTVRIYDALEEQTVILEQKFVIYENNFGEFTLSFQV